jgi:hypothetical protein
MFLSALLPLILTAPAAAGAPEDCGLTPQLVPDFSLVDANPHSPTFGETFTRAGQLGKPWLLYWADAG